MSRKLIINCTNFLVSNWDNNINVVIPLKDMDMKKFINEFVYNFDDEHLLAIKSEIEKYFAVKAISFDDWVKINGCDYCKAHKDAWCPLCKERWIKDGI